jgi:hypothetical protein
MTHLSDAHPYQQIQTATGVKPPGKAPPRSETVVIFHPDRHVEAYADVGSKVLLVNQPSFGRGREDLAREWIYRHSPYWAKRFLEHRFAGDLRARGNFEVITIDDLLRQDREMRAMKFAKYLEKTVKKVVSRNSIDRVLTELIEAEGGPGNAD